MSSVIETIKTIINAIPGVCGPDKDNIQRSEEFVQEKGEDIPAILSGLNNICGGIFMSRAGLVRDIPQDQVDIIDSALIGVGRTPPSNIALKKKVGATDLTTTAKDLSRAVNEHDSEIGILSDLVTLDTGNLVDAINGLSLGSTNDEEIYEPIGTLGSFYSCTSLTDTSPTLIASGKNTLSLMVGEEKRCDNWAFLTEFTIVNSKITTDTSDDSVYVSISSSGGCFNAVGGLQTLPVLANTNISDSNKVDIPAIEVICSDSGCLTVETSTDFGYDTFAVPSLEVTCVNNICTTPAIDVISAAYNYNISIPSLTVGFISPTAGSLSALCVYELDN